MGQPTATITMRMREVGRLKTVQAVVDRMLQMGQAAQRLGLSSTTDGAVLRQSTQSHADLRTLLRAQLLFCMLGAPDGHAKNFSIRRSPGRFRHTPIYHLMSIWPMAVSASTVRMRRS